MNAIKEALERLNASINTLEFNADVSTSKRQEPQGDMFTAVPPAAPPPSNQNSAVVAQRLDNAIEAVEKLLKGA